MWLATFAPIEGVLSRGSASVAHLSAHQFSVTAAPTAGDALSNHDMILMKTTTYCTVEKTTLLHSDNLHHAGNVKQRNKAIVPRND